MNQIIIEEGYAVPVVEQMRPEAQVGTAPFIQRYFVVQIGDGGSCVQKPGDERSSLRNDAHRKIKVPEERKQLLLSNII